MYQAPARVWNQIAEAGPLRTGWAEQMFPLPDDLLLLGLENEEKRLAQILPNGKTVAAYLTVMPMLWEAQAIRNWQAVAGPSMAVFPLESVEQAMRVAMGDYRLEPQEQEALRALLLVEPE